MAFIFECCYDFNRGLSFFCLFSHPSGPLLRLQSMDKPHAADKSTSSAIQKQEEEDRLGTEKNVPEAALDATFSSPRYWRKRRSSSLLFTSAPAVTLGNLAGVGFLGRDIGLRWRKIRHRMKVEATLPLVLYLVVMRVLEAITHGGRRRRGPSCPWPVWRKGRPTARSTRTRPTKRRRSW